MKTKTLLIAAVMFLALTAGAYAQATYSVGSIPVTAVINTGLTERTGDLTFFQQSGLSNVGTITVNYGVPITIPFTAVTVTGQGAYLGNAGLNVNTVASNNAAGILVINVPGGLNTGSFTVSGVRVAVAGTTLTSLSANISSTNNAIIAGQTSVVVISSIAPGIGSVSTSSSGSGARANINAATGTITYSPSSAASAIIAVKEGFLNAFNDINPNTLYGVGLRFTLTAAPPPGVTITFPASGVTNGAGAPQFVAVDPSATTTPLAPTAITSSSTSLSAFYRLTSAQDPTLLETATFAVAVTFSGSSNLPLPAGTLQFNTTLWPIGTAFTSSGAVITTQSSIPRYVELLVGPTTLVNITSATTTLLVPFAQRVSSINYDTGFSIANTTEDPGSSMSAAVTGAAVPQSGAITFYFYPQLPSPSGTNPANSSYTTTAGSPGTGIDASGRVPAGSTYIVLLSELLQAAGLPADFAGYVFIVTNFTDAHAFFTVSNFTTFSQGSLALVVTGDRTAAAESLNQ
jgi:hypothetical protein